jgi:hypothetical protein
MPDAVLATELANAVNGSMGGKSLRFVKDEEAVHKAQSDAPSL